MDQNDIKRVKRLQADLSKIQGKLTDELVKAAGSGRLSIEDLEISVARIGSSALRRPINASRKNVSASRRPIESASRRPL